MKVFNILEVGEHFNNLREVRMELTGECGWFSLTKEEVKELRDHLTKLLEEAS